MAYEYEERERELSERAEKALVARLTRSPEYLAALDAAIERARRPREQRRLRLCR
jgi:hypothetical protein